MLEYSSDRDVKFGDKRTVKKRKDMICGSLCHLNILWEAGVVEY
jgi:hypothetical protein